MNDVRKQSDDVIVGKTEEAEERNVPVAKLVKALDFQSNNRGFDPHQEYKKDMNCWGKNIVKTTDTINGRAFSRLSVF